MKEKCLYIIYAILTVYGLIAATVAKYNLLAIIIGWFLYFIATVFFAYLLKEEPLEKVLIHYALFVSTIAVPFIVNIFGVVYLTTILFALIPAIYFPILLTMALIRFIKGDIVKNCIGVVIPAIWYSLLAILEPIGTSGLWSPYVFLLFTILGLSIYVVYRILVE